MAGGIAPIAHLAGKVNASNELAVSVSGAGSGGTSAVDGATFTADVSAGTPAMGAYQSSVSALTDGDLGIVALDVNRNLKVNVVAGSTGNAAASATGAAVPASADFIGFKDPSGNLTGVAASNLDFDTGAGTVAQTIIGIALPASGGPVAGGTSTNPLQIGDAGGSLTVDDTITANIGTVATLATAAKQDTGNTSLASIDGKITAVNTGAVVVASSALPSGASTAAKQPALGTAGAASTDVLTVQGIASMTPLLATATAVGTIADDATTPGAPVMAGGFMKNFDGTDPGNVSTEDDVVRFITDPNRRQYVNTVHPFLWSYHSDGSSALTDASVAAAPGAGYSHFVTDVVVSTGAATALNVFFEEGSTKVLGPYYLEAVAGRGIALHFGTPKKITANTALTVTTSAAIAQCVDVLGFTAKV